MFVLSTLGHLRLRRFGLPPSTKLDATDRKASDYHGRDVVGIFAVDSLRGLSRIDKLLVASSSTATFVRESSVSSSFFVGSDPHALLCSRCCARVGDV